MQLHLGMGLEMGLGLARGLSVPCQEVVSSYFTVFETRRSLECK